MNSLIFMVVLNDDLGWYESEHDLVEFITVLFAGGDKAALFDQ